MKLTDLFVSLCHQTRYIPLDGEWPCPLFGARRRYAKDKLGCYNRPSPWWWHRWSRAGELIGEICLPIEMGCDVEDIALTIHPHPALCGFYCI